MDRRGILWDSNTPAGSICVLRNTYAAMPAILVEPGFVGNDHDAAKLKDKYWRERVAKRIASALTDKEN
jgi:N-acetylmuramoyl-L-alanine amidase